MLILSHLIGLICGDRQLQVIYWALNFIELQHKFIFFCTHSNCKNKIWLYASPNSVLFKQQFSLYCLNTCIFLVELWWLTSTPLIFKQIQNFATLIQAQHRCLVSHCDSLVDNCSRGPLFPRLYYQIAKALLVAKDGWHIGY